MTYFEDVVLADEIERLPLADPLLRLARITHPAREPLDLSAVKLYLRVEYDDDDALIQRLIQSSREQVEEFLGRALITQRWRLWMDRRPRGTLELPRPPLQTVEPIVFFDDSDNELTWDEVNYQVDNHSDPGRIWLRRDGQWPTDLRRRQSIRIDYTAGYGDSELVVPDAIKQAILRIVATRYEHREDTTVGRAIERHPDSIELLNPYRVVRL